MPKSIIVNQNQKGNPVLELIKSQPWEYGDIVPDYLVGESNALLFLSLKYHRLHPEYISTRIKTIIHFKLRILLVLSDIQANQQAIRELTKIAIDNKVTMIVAWSEQDAAKYIQVFKQYETKPPDLIRERIEEDSFSKFSNCLTQIKHISKTDVVTLSSRFKTLKEIIDADGETLRSLPGFGDEKVKQLQQAFDTPFLLSK